MAKINNGTLKTWGLILTMVLAAAGFIFALGAQNQKLEMVCSEQSQMKQALSGHDRSITTLETDIKYIRKAVDDIREEVKK